MPRRVPGSAAAGDDGRWPPSASGGCGREARSPVEAGETPVSLPSGRTFPGHPQKTTMSEWTEWHRRYQHEPPMARRLEAVRRIIRSVLSDAAPGRVRVVSLCAGDGRDLLGVLARHPRARDVTARLIELDPELVRAGRERARRLGLSTVEFVRGDAASRAPYEGALPADLVLACGIFGNISDEDVRRTIRHLPQLCRSGATVVWTRGRFEPDLTPAIRSWFSEAGFEELSFEAIPDSTAAVGAHRLVRGPSRPSWRRPLFTFLSKALRPSSRRPQPARRGCRASTQVGGTGGHPVLPRSRPQPPRSGRAQARPSPTRTTSA